MGCARIIKRQPGQRSTPISDPGVRGSDAAVVLRFLRETARVAMPSCCIRIRQLRPQTPSRLSRMVPRSAVTFALVRFGAMAAADRGVIPALSFSGLRLLQRPVNRRVDERSAIHHASRWTLVEGSPGSFPPCASCCFIVPSNGLQRIGAAWCRAPQGIFHPCQLLLY